jgi:hypothetical protein
VRWTDVRPRTSFHKIDKYPDVVLGTNFSIDIWSPLSTLAAIEEAGGM